MDSSPSQSAGRWRGRITVGTRRQGGDPLPDFHCSFCGLPQTETRRLIAGPGPGGPYICNDCVRLCGEMFAEQGRGYGPPPDENPPTADDR